jgi:hypothetical protein
MWKEVVVAYCKVLTRHLPAPTGNMLKDLRVEGANIVCLY